MWWKSKRFVYLAFLAVTGLVWLGGYYALRPLLREDPSSRLVCVLGIAVFILGLAPYLAVKLSDSIYGIVCDWLDALSRRLRRLWRRGS